MNKILYHMVNNFAFFAIAMLLVSNTCTAALGQMPMQNRSKDSQILVVEPRDRDQSGNTLLHYAAEAGNETEVNQLLQNMASVHAQNNEGKTPAQLAAKGKHKIILTLLLKQAKADIDLLDGVQKTCQSAIESALTRGAMPYCQDAQKNTVLHLVCTPEFPNVLAIKILKHFAHSIGNKINMQNKDGYTPLHLAILNGHNEHATILLQQAATDPNIVEYDKGDTALHTATLGNNTELTSLLLQRDDLNPNIFNDDCFTPLHIAVSQNTTALLECFLGNKKVDINIHDDPGTTPLIFAISQDKNNALPLLLQHPDIDLYKRDGSKRSPVIIALFSENTLQLKTLIDTGYSPTKEGLSYTDFCKIIQEATYNDAVKIKEFCGLIEPYFDCLDNTFIDHHQIVNLPKQSKNASKKKPVQIKQQPAQIQTIFDAIHANNLRAVETIVQKDHASIHAVQSKTGDTPLHLAIKLNAFAITKYLMEQDATLVDMCNKSEESPLHIAVKMPAKKDQNRTIATDLALRTNITLVQKVIAETDEKKYPLVKVIKDSIKEDNPPEQSNSNQLKKTGDIPNITPFSKALLFVQKDDAAGLETFLQNQQDFLIDTHDELGNTLLHYASNINACKTISLLLAYGADQFILNNDAKSAQQRAVAKGHKKASLLLSAYESTHQAFRTGNAQAVTNSLIQHNVACLSEYGKQDNRRDNSGALPLCLAASHLHSHVLKTVFDFVLNHHSAESLANILSLTDASGRTLIHWLADPKKTIHKTVDEAKVQACLAVIMNPALLKHKAYHLALYQAFAYQDTNGDTPVSLAEKNGLKNYFLL